MARIEPPIETLLSHITLSLTLCCQNCVDLRSHRILPFLDARNESSSASTRLPFYLTQESRDSTQCNLVASIDSWHY